MITHVLAKVVSIFLMLAVGALARFRKVITDEALDNLCRIVLYVTLPFLFLYVLTTRCTKEILLSLWAAPLFAASIILTGYLIGSLAARILRLPPRRRDAFTFLISFQNSGFLAIPIALVLFGEEGVLSVIIFSIGFNILYWTFGVWLFSRSSASGIDKNLFKNLLNPGLIALALGIILSVFCIKMPRFFLDTSRILGDATIPLAMLVVGALLAGNRYKRGADLKEISLVVLCRLVVIPLIFLSIAGRLENISPLLRSIIVLQACMPSASTGPLLAKRFGGDYNLMASGVFYTTLFSIITVPLFMSLI